MLAIVSELMVRGLFWMNSKWRTRMRMTPEEVGIYDILGNRITLKPRVGGNVVYASNTVNEYTDIGGVGAM